MAISTVTLTGDIANLIGGDFDARRTKVWLEANTDFVVDEDNQQIRLGTATATVGADGTFTFADLIASDSTDVNPTDFQYRLWVDYAQASDRTRAQQTFGWWSITDDADVSELIEEQFLEPTWQSNLDAAMAGHAEDEGSDFAGALAGSYARIGSLANVGEQFVTNSGNDSNNGRSWGAAKATIAAAVTALRANGGGVLRLGYGSFSCSATVNLTNLTGVEIRGQGSAYTALVLNTGQIGIDATGTARLRLHGLQLYTIGQSTPATVGLLQARSVTNGTVEFCHLSDVWFNMAHDAAANGSKGTIGIYNRTGEITMMDDNCVVSADRPYVATLTNTYSISSALVTSASVTSMSVVEIQGSPTLISLGGPAITLEGAANFWFQGYLNRGSGSATHAIEVMSECTELTFHASIEGFTKALKTIAHIRGLHLIGRINPGVGDGLVLLDGSTGGTPGITGGRIDLAPPSNNTNAHVLIDDGTGANQLGIYDLDLHLWAYQSIDAPATIAAGCTIRSDATAPTLSMVTGDRGNVILTRTYTRLTGSLSVTSGQPVFAAGAGGGTSAPTPNTSSANANRGDINFGSGTGPSAGVMLTATFTTAYAAAPKVVISPSNAATAALGLYATATTTAITISATNAPAASQGNGTYNVQYVVLG